ncbi:MAG: PEP-CTERM sorting domain-containing protein [Chthonomonas sp.]|nr:PEP-CTERM sorting domain-containing protein [Chthonomonas sp.]
MRSLISICFVAAVTSAAYAGTLSATYASSFGKNVQFTLSSANKDQGTVQWNGTRTGGTDTLVPATYNAYCVELGEFINTGVNTTHQNVTPLLGSSTVPGGVVFNSGRTDAMERLWGSYFGLVNTAEKSAAFQLAVWEIAFDNDLSLTNASGNLVGRDRDASMSGIQLDPVSQIAQGWLMNVATGAATQRQKLLLLSGQGTQDLITPVPEPASIFAIAVGAAMLARRRKNRA